MGETIAIIGIGGLGSALVRGLLSEPAHFALHIFDRSAAKCEALVAPGRAAIAESVADAVADADAVVLCVKPHATLPLVAELKTRLASTSAIISGFANGTSVAVAIAAIDAVKNVGPLSTVACATPDRVNGFDELYHQDGGTAGGGFCSLSHLPANRGGTGATAFSLVMLSVAARRRRARPASK